MYTWTLFNVILYCLVTDISSAELVIQGRLWIHGRIVRSLRWYGRNLVTFGENCCCHNLNIKIVWYIKIFSLEWNFTRNLSKLSEFWPKKLKKLFKGSLAKKSDVFFLFFFFCKKKKKKKKNQKNVKNIKLIKNVRKLFLNTCIWMALDFFEDFCPLQFF